MSSQPKPHLTAQEYLALERKADCKSEYYRGEMFAQAGASRSHNRIVANLLREVGNSLKAGTCEILPSDMRVRVSRTGLYTYPDALIVFGEAQFEDDQLDTLLNPTILIEVLSRSTESYDRGVKVSHYRKLESLQEYILIAQDRPSFESYRRQPDGGWLLQEASSLEENAVFHSIDIRVPMTEIYRNVEFEDVGESRSGRR